MWQVEEDRNETRREWAKRLMCLQTRHSRKKMQKRKLEKEEQKERKVNNNQHRSVRTDSFQGSKIFASGYIFSKGKLQKETFNIKN